MKKTTAIFILVLLASAATFSQEYQEAAGLRIGAGGGITYRRFIAADLSAELMLLSQNNGLVGTLLVQKHRPALLFDRLDMSFIYGAGVHIGMADRFRLHNDSFDRNYIHSRYNSLQLGIDGFAALEYQVPDFPVALSLECKPYFELFDDHLLGIHLPVMAIGARYTF